MQLSFQFLFVRITAEISSNFKITMHKIVSLVFLSFFLVGCNASNSETKQDPITDNSSQTNMIESKTVEYGTPQSGDQVATIKTTAGEIKIKLFADQTPETVKNFVTLAQEGKYKGVAFHRVIKDFMIQGGDFEFGNGMGGYSYKGPNTKIDDEFVPELTHVKGALSMANAGPNTNGSQFFIVHAQATPHLDGRHTVFGYVFEGMDVVDAIASKPVDPRDRPLEDVIINEVEIANF
jgi:peptidyl-prolyl cis-trans isomerase B (cyclophilin B)